MPAAYASAEKRTELVRAAKALFHQQGFQRTTLADVAARATVPVGNVFYYFKTKEALAEAVIASHEADLHESFAAWTARHVDPRKRLRALVLAPLDAADAVIHFGCPYGSLCQELEKLGPDEPLAKAAARLMSAYIEWATQQFLELGHRPANARARANDVIAAVQGTMLLAHSLRSRDFLARQLRRIERGLDDFPPERHTRNS
jgi:TetR/AcrR family transcriptional repressor of nem operon